MLFEFTEPERNTMRRALELYVSELRGEIAKTEKHEWLQALREEKTILKGVIEQLSVCARVNFAPNSRERAEARSL